MTQYINKDALVVEIERLARLLPKEEGLSMNLDWARNTLSCLYSFINTLEVKEEIKIGETQIYLNDDGGEPPYDGKQWLDLSCMEYEIPEDKFKDGDSVEIIIRKEQKGE